MSRPKVEEAFSEQVNLHVTKYTKRWLVQIAHQQRRPLAQMLRIILEDFIEANKSSVPAAGLDAGVSVAAGFQSVPGNFEHPN